MKTLFLTSFVLCFVCFMLRTAFNILKYKKNKLAEKRIVFNGILIVMFVLWSSWFFMVFNDPFTMNIPVWVRFIGLALFITGISLFILSHIKLKGFEDKGYLVRRGIYSKIRNPMYLGFILWIIGLPIFLCAVVTSLSAIIWSTFFMYWRMLEEKELLEKYEEYKEYKKRTWF